MCTGYSWTSTMLALNNMSVAETVENKCNFTKEPYSLTWALDHFDYAPFISDNPVFGPSIRMGMSVWQILMSKSLRVNGQKSIGFRLVKLDGDVSWDACEFSVCLKSKDGMVSVRCIDGVVVSGDENDPYIYCPTKEELTLKVRQMEIDDSICDSPCRARDDSLSFEDSIASSPSQAELDAILDVQDLVVAVDMAHIYLVENASRIFEPSPEQLLTRDLKQLLKSRKFSDVVLSTEQTEFHAHKNILSARVSGFDELLQRRGEKLELKTSDKVAEALLLFIYAGEFSEDMEMDDYQSLYAAARKYGVHNLQKICQEMKNKFKIDNVCNGCQKKVELLLDSSEESHECTEKKVFDVNTIMEMVEVEPPIKFDKAEGSKSPEKIEERFEVTKRPLHNGPVEFAHPPLGFI